MLTKFHPKATFLNKDIKSIVSRSNKENVSKILIRTVTAHVADKTDPIPLIPFEQIPCPPGLNLPVIGHTAHFIKKPNGFEKSWKNVLDLKNKYVPPGVEMLRFNLPLSNPAGQGKLLVIFDPGNSIIKNLPLGYSGAKFTVFYV
jgi:hypothetical protein